MTIVGESANRLPALERAWSMQWAGGRPSMAMASTRRPPAPLRLRQGVDLGGTGGARGRRERRRAAPDARAVAGLKFSAALRTGSPAPL